MSCTRTICSPVRTSLTRSSRPLPASVLSQHQRRRIQTLKENPHIYIHSSPLSPSTHTLSLLPTTPPNPSLAIGTTTSLPPTPSSFTENPSFLPILSSVLSTHASQDPFLISQAQSLASSSGPRLSPPSPQPQNRRDRKPKGTSTTPGSDTGAGGASAQGGAGGGGATGYVHVSDTRKPPDFGRIAEPEDIFGSLEVDHTGAFVDGSGRFQWAGTYRVVTREGVLGLSGFLRGKVVERLRGEEERVKGDGGG